MNNPESLGTLFTADYNPAELSLASHWQDGQWSQSLDNFQEGTRRVVYGTVANAHQYNAMSVSTEWVQHLAILGHHVADRAQFSRWMESAQSGEPDWAAFARVFTDRHA